VVSVGEEDVGAVALRGVPGREDLIQPGGELVGGKVDGFQILALVLEFFRFFLVDVDVVGKIELKVLRLLEVAVEALTEDIKALRGKRDCFRSISGTCDIEGKGTRG